MKVKIQSIMDYFKSNVDQYGFLHGYNLGIDQKYQKPWIIL